MRADLSQLRAQIRAIETQQRGALTALGTGADGFDDAVGGGLALGGVNEFVPAAFMDEPASISFALVCAAMAMHQRAGDLVVIEDGTHARNWGALYGPGLQALGVDSSRVLLVSTPTVKATHACLEDCARTTGLAGVLALAGPKAGFSLGGARRIQLAAEHGQSLVILVQSLRTPRFAPAFMRLCIASAPSRGTVLRGASLPDLGAPAWSIHLERARSGTRPQTFEMEYDNATHRLYQPTALAYRPLIAQKRA